MSWIRPRDAITASMLLLCAAESSQAQHPVSGVYHYGVAVPTYDAPTQVFREHIEVSLPPSYLLVSRPRPPVRGFYAWKFTFGTTPVATFVFRPDTALSATSDRAVIHSSSLYLCQSTEQWVMDCKIPVRASARMGVDGIVVDITDPQIVAKMRQVKPGVLLREFFEPGGRFRVDEVGIKYRGIAADGS